MFGLDIVRMAERQAVRGAVAAVRDKPRQQQQQPQRPSRHSGLQVLAAGAIVTAGVLIMIPVVKHGTSLPTAAPPASSANWMYARDCGLPKQDFDVVASDVSQLQDAYQRTALNTQDIAVQLRADTQAAAHCQPMIMPPADRKLYAAALFQAVTAAKAAQSDPAAIPGHLSVASGLLATVAKNTGEGN